MNSRFVGDGGTGAGQRRAPTAAGDLVQGNLAGVAIQDHGVVIVRAVVAEDDPRLVGRGAGGEGDLGLQRPKIKFRPGHQLGFAAAQGIHVHLGGADAPGAGLGVDVGDGRGEVVADRLRRAGGVVPGDRGDLVGGVDAARNGEI